MSACVTLLTDLGLQDTTVGVVKGILRQHVAGSVPLIDLSHALDISRYAGAAYALKAAYSHFPKGSCHLVLFDTFSERSARMVHCFYEGYHFLAPDNTILPLAFEELTEGALCYEPAFPFTFAQWVETASKVISGLLKPKSFVSNGYPIIALAQPKRAFKVETPVPSLDCTVLHIDHFGNVVLDLQKEQFEKIAIGRPFRILLLRNDEISTISDNISEVPISDKLCRFNSAGYLEVAVRKGNAAQLFGLRLHREDLLLYRHIKIFFG
jgi:S-adenosylmethionine hydrolase